MLNNRAVTVATIIGTTLQVATVVAGREDGKPSVIQGTYRRVTGPT
jgi:hypothetical protein